jgi:drug/metabolite transporter (DMT)-like permease
MERQSTGFFRSLTQSGHFYLWTATLMFAAANTLTRKLNMLGHEHLIDGRNPISLCNVLFVGNLCALIVMLCLFSRDWQWQQVKRLRRRDWISLSLIGLLSGALVPALTFAALDRTTVTSVVIVSRLGPPLSLILGFLIIGSRLNRYTFFGTIAACVGVSVTGLLAAVIVAIADVLTKIYLKTVSLGIFAITRTAIGTIVFFFLAQILYGPHHFFDVFSPFLWGWMVIYSLFIVVIGQLCWFSAQKIATTAELTLASVFQPLLAIFVAFLVLGEVPMMAHIIGGSILLLGIGLSAIGTLQDMMPSSKA